MELPPCSESARNALLSTLSRIQDTATPQGEFMKSVEYVVKTFPNIMLDVARLLTEQAVEKARSDCEPAEALRHQLKPFIAFAHLLGKSPQINGLMYSYFENSSFQPLPVDSFQLDHGQITYTRPGFDDNVARDILISYLKYLSFNPRWFGAVWNWSELARYISLHTSHEMRYLATCCLSIITKPDRHQHIGLLQDVIPQPQTLIKQQMEHSCMFDNIFRPIVETISERKNDFIKVWGPSPTGYQYGSELLAKITNVLLLKRVIKLDPEQQRKYDKIMNSYIPIDSLRDTISKIAYAASVNKPCLIRGATGAGKTAILDYIACHTNRLCPPDYVKVQVGDQIDSKSLVGSYVCTEIPGQFEWQPGPLTQAMSYGSWIVFEDIDSAPSEMAQVIHSVIENGNLSCVSCCPIKMDNPHPDFKIFFTQTTKSNQQTLKLGFGFIERLCDIIDLPELQYQDLHEMIEKRYQFSSLTNIVLQLYKAAQEALIALDNTRATRHITLRDLFKFCDRIATYPIKPKDERYTPQDIDFLLSNAIECFVVSLPHDSVPPIVRTMGNQLNMPASEINTIINRKPDFVSKGSTFAIGRIKMDAHKTPGGESLNLDSRLTLAHTKQSLQLMEAVSASIKSREPVLLVGETGVGKTTIVQNLANMMNMQLEVMNLSQQSDSSDLLGGYRPVEMREIMRPIHKKFTELFSETFNTEANEHFLEKAIGLYESSNKCRDWLHYLKLVQIICVQDTVTNLSKANFNKWKALLDRVRNLTTRLSEDETSSMGLTFTDGTLLKAVREGKWLLLDEINLAEPDVLQCLLQVLDSMNEAHVYVHTGGSERDGPTSVHRNFRIFACMNPSTDIGKRDLPVGIRNRFTEFFVDDVMEPQDLRLIIESYVGTCLSRPQIDSLVNFYREVRFRVNILSDISGNSPVYSLRTLCRALVICAQNVCRNMERSLLESLKITFLQQLNEFSMIQVLKLIELTIFKGTTLDKISTAPIQKPSDSNDYVEVEGFWIQTSSQEHIVDKDYILTKSVRKNLERLCRILCLGQRKLPILIQGETSVGKTSLIKYLAKLTGNLCYRINNHEHTDLQDYIGRYVLKENGELVFRDGLLVTAMKRGYWVILDELNLAPSELLEALNRVLDGNRELFIPETGETIKAHSKFTLFATQNPPQEYAGRKLLSRAFRNRFIELHFDEIPHDELQEILHKRCKMAPQHAKKIVTVMKELQIRRRESGCFGGKSSFMTIRDLFRWGQRYLIYKDTVKSEQFFDWNQHLANEGLILLEGRVRTTSEADVVKDIIEGVFKCSLDRRVIYGHPLPPITSDSKQLKHIHFTREFERIFVQLSRALQYKEPVLLCGQTGCGKTTAAQLYAAKNEQKMITYNCHLNTECSDFIGNVRPSRDSQSGTSCQTFPWHDGPMVQAMKEGAVFLMDEISLADDAVLERINSVLEPDRSITITELNGDEIVANENFRFVATMNPGGDFGKKELSLALRNRFTEIYCYNTLDVKQIVAIVEKSLVPALLQPRIAPNLIKCIQHFLTQYYENQDIISIRDVLNWIVFLNRTTTMAVSPLSVQDALIHGACLVYFDQFGTCGHSTIHSNASPEMRDRLRDNLIKMVESKFGKQPVFNEKSLSAIAPLDEIDNYVRFGKFVLRKGPKKIEVVRDFIHDAPTVEKNAQKLVRALQLDRPVLLEGDPGAGKTSIVAALARKTGHELVRINLSEQTDISDLFGSDLPDTTNTEDDRPRFCWHDGPMLKAIKESGWILLDEMNLASQSVLEGLNACFDHRGEIYIPELDRTFIVNRNSTRIFACQNPYNQGAARKGLPKSFLNRFTSIYVEPHQEHDLIIILTHLYTKVPVDIIEKMVQFNHQISELYRDQGYEFNLRDLIHWCDLMTRYVRDHDLQPLQLMELYEPDRFVQFVYIDRIRSSQDKNDICDLFERIFGYPVYEPPYRDLKIGELSFIMARAVLPRKTRLPPHLTDLCILKYQMPFIESVAKAIEFNKMPILVGETSVGKRSIVRILAGITGNELNVVGANRDMDTIELLGSFEQKSVQRQIVDLVDDAVKFAISLINSTPRGQQTDSWTRLYEYTWFTLYVTSRRDLKLSKSAVMDTYRYQIAQMEKLINFMQPLSINQTESKCKEWKIQIANLKKKILYHSESTYSCGNFEWIDSVLIKSIKEGTWLVIENANLMNPATLDRLNSLVESNGTLGLNEKGSGPNGVEILKPHPNFRLILTMNPEHGELSRAMRNRGVEIYVRTRFFYEDYLMLLNQNGFVPEESKACMTYCIMQTSYDVHEKITGEKPEDDGSLLAYFGLNYSANLANQIRRGVNVETILSDLLLSFYHKKGHIENTEDESIHKFVVEQLKKYGKTYIVDLNDSRYKWCHFRHDLMSITGGDAIPTALRRERKIFQEFSDPLATGLLKANELLECYDIVVACTSIKIFLELSSHSDFAYRKKIVRDAFSAWPKLIDLMDSELDAIEKELLPKINCIVNDDELASFQLVPSKELYVDTRNSLDFHYYLQTINLKGASEAEDLQNRWILSLHRISLLMLVELVEENSYETPNATSLWSMAEKVRLGDMVSADLIRPQVEVATDLYDLLNGLLRVVSNREYPNELVTKMMARTFWIGYILCKLRRRYTEVEHIALSNQLPMLWTLTYQKIVLPLISDCKLADLVYNNKKFSARIKHICEFLDVVISKPSKVEKEYYNRVVNVHAATTKRTECLSREIDKFFNMLLRRYTIRSERLGVGSENASTLIASSLPWSTSTYMASLYSAITTLTSVDFVESDSLDGLTKVKSILTEVRKIIVDKKAEYDQHEKLIRENENYRQKCLTINRGRSALDQFAPVWQTKYLLTRLSRLHPEVSPADASHYENTLRKSLSTINGIVMSPRYASTINKLLQVVAGRSSQVDSDASKRQNIDMYTAFLVDHILENMVVDSQVVGWVKMRVNTTDLATEAPLIPEYCPIVSLVSSYCLDISHLKLNSYQKTSPQLDSMLLYLWRAYSLIKSGTGSQDRDLSLAKNLMHLRLQIDHENELVGDHMCQSAYDCCCIDKYISRRLATFEGTIKLVEHRSDPEDRAIFERAIRLIYLGFYNALEYAPIFTLDPSLRSREKIEVYKSELAHIKADLFQRNALYYWRTGENLRLIDMSTDEAKLFPMSIRALVERRDKLERSIEKLRRVFTNRPKTDDGSLYCELRKEVEVSISRTTNNIGSLMNDLTAYLMTKKPLLRPRRISLLTTKCRMLIKNTERTIARFKSNYALYSDLTTNFLVGYCFMLQGLRLLYSRLEQKMRLADMGFTHGLSDRFASDIMKLFSFNDSTLTNMESVSIKRGLYPILNLICPEDRVSYMQSLILKASLLQLHHLIITTPSDIEKCIPIVRNIADKFHKAWLDRKKYLEEQRKKQEDIYQYKTSHTSLNEVSYERQEFIDICTKFPLYDHIYRDTIGIAAATSADQDNLDTEAKIVNLNRSVDLTMCIDVCKAHYKFMKEASQELLGQQDGHESKADLRNLDMSQLIKIEAEVLYSIIRKCIANLDENFDSLSVECHLLQANELYRVLKEKQPDQFQVGSLRSSIEILDEKIFDIYHDACPQEVIKFEALIVKIDEKIDSLRNDPAKSLDSHPMIHQISKLTERITSFLITDPLMKFVTGAHTLLSHLEDWNKNIQRDCRMIAEADCLVELIQAWRAIEVKSWRSSLHRVKRKYIDNSLCDLWFRLYEAFDSPLESTNQLLIDRELVDEDFELEVGEHLYQGFAFLIKDFLESATLGDYQIRLDLVFSFTIQTRFASEYRKATAQDAKQEIDFEKLTTYVHNVYLQYQGLMVSHKSVLEREESELVTLLNNEIRIVNWQGRNLWEIKNNFRCSHQKLNKVMNRYLEVLRRPLPKLNSDAVVNKRNMVTEVQGDPNSLKLDRIFDRVQLFVDGTQIHLHDDCKLVSLKYANKIVNKLKKFSNDVHSTTKARYVEMLRIFEDTYCQNANSIQTFYKHRVQDLVIHPKDSKEARNDKLKTSRQIYHTKKFAMQAIFKNLRDLGSSYQRGLNTSHLLDKSILSFEPLRGMIQNQSVSVLEAASKLVDDQLIISCNQMYRELMTNNQVLLAQSRGEDISGDQMERIRGYALDMVLDIILHSKNAAIVYRHLMHIQAATTRLQQLQQLCDGDKVYVYKFSRVHGSIMYFNEIVSRSIASLAKLEMLMDCFKTYAELQKFDDYNQSNGAVVASESERSTLRDLINETDEENSLMTHEQYEHLQDHLSHVRKSIAEISSALRNKLRHTIKNHLYSDDDIQEIQQLYEEFINTLNRVSPRNNQNLPNFKKGTILGSLKLLRQEAEGTLKPILRNEYFTGKVDRINLDEHPNLSKLDIRLQKLIKQTKLSAQEIFKAQRGFNEVQPIGEAAKRRMKPFNHIDSSSIRDLLRPLQVSKQVSNCFMTLNLEKQCTNIKPLIAKLAPILLIYVQEAARNLNVILCSTHQKLLTANQLIPFFTDLVVNGFGLPCKIEDLEGSGQETTNGTGGEDNVGFGEGEGDADASKKIEFESQLDELKKEDDERSKEESEANKGPETENIEAHDDGVEMSEDFEAKPEGAGEVDPDADEDENKSNGDDDEDCLNELDKEFDEVDQDEGNLEQELWDDKDEPLGDDNEEDLRQADVEQSARPDMEEKDLLAKDVDLEQNGETGAENTEATDDQHLTDEEVEQEKSIDASNMEFEDISEEDFDSMVDMDTKEHSQPDDAENTMEDSIDFDIEEDAPEPGDTSAEIDVEAVEKDSKQEEEDERDTENKAGAMDESAHSESDIEVVEEIKTKDVGKSGLDSKGDGGDSTDKVPDNDTEGATDDQKAPSSAAKSEKLNQSNPTDGARDDKEQEGDHHQGADDDDDEISGKRTFAERASFDQASLKRQKIESSTPSANEQKRNEDNVRVESESVRHVEKAKDDDIEVIDLASTDDELLLDNNSEPERMDPQQQLPGRTRGSDEGQIEKSEQDVAKPDDPSARLEQQQSSYSTNIELLKFISHGLADKEEKANGDAVDLMEQIDNILNEKVDGDEHESITTDRLTSLWLDCTRSTGHLVHELCQQLQIVLQPTKMSKYKGDYKSGKRLNMRKIVSYIASHYRKDKIWLRRTKPCKRTYNISLAVDNSSSMSENNCRQMTYQSLALLAKSLSLIEAGALNVVSFGKQVKSIHDFDQPYVDAIGAQWLRELKFDESSTSYKSVLRHSCESFAKQAQVSLSAHQQAGSNLSVNQLLIIISDGRNVSSESEDVKLYLKQLKSMGVLTLFVIIDDPKQNGGKSIVDIKKSIVRPGCAMVLESYMDSFPFPFYVILRQIEKMPSILGEALRQWFELVSNGA